jgi:PHD/YefM family antitoxin component YafN of YafNO toxin-antitoxin module
MVETQLHPSAEQHDNPENRAAYSVAEFRENPQRLFRLLRADRSHLTLTVEGEPEAVLLAPAEYQRLLDLAADADVSEAIRQSTEDEKAGRTQAAKEFFAEFRAKHGLSGRR